MSGSGRSPLRDPGQPQAQWPDSLHLAQGVFGFPLPLAWLPTAMAVSSGRLWVSTLLRRLGLKGSKELSLPFVFALFFLFVLFLLLYFSIIVNWGWSFRISVIGVPGPKARFCNLRQTSGAAWVRKWSFKIVSWVSWDVGWYVSEGPLLIFLKKQRVFLGPLANGWKFIIIYRFSLNSFHSFY